MPNYTHKRYRLWCKQCDNFTLHERIYKDEFKHPKFDQCKFVEEETYASLCECGCQYSDVYITDIDKEKLLEQRNRFKEKRKEKTLNIFSKYARLGALDLGLEKMFSPPEIGYEVIESDAGLEYEEELEREIQAKIKHKEYIELLTYKNVGRNDICLCGSGIKYKKCCLIKHLKY